MNQSDDLIRSAQFNYMFQLDWLVSQYPFKFRQCPLTIIHGYQDDREFDSIVHKYQHIEPIKAHLLPFGTHHTKMMYLLYNIVSLYFSFIFGNNSLIQILNSI
jgi:tyrosyl-DNA phosphodiesterase-1